MTKQEKIREGVEIQEEGAGVAPSLVEGGMRSTLMVDHFLLFDKKIKKYYGKSMRLEDLIKDFTPRQREYLICLAMKPRKLRNLSDGVRKATLSVWKGSDAFSAVLYQVVDGDFTSEALGLYFRDKLPDYVKSVHEIAVGAESERVRLEAVKFALSLAGGEKQKDTSGSIMQKYMEENEVKK